MDDKDTMIEQQNQAIDPDYSAQSGSYLDINLVSAPAWVKFGPRTAPDTNQYTFAHNVDCEGNTLDPSRMYVISKSVTISPPDKIQGSYEIRWSASDGNAVTWLRIPFVVTRPPNELPAGEAGIDIKGSAFLSVPTARIASIASGSPGFKVTITRPNE